jgi:DNA-binding MarR family transcriptional regulator
VGRHAGLSDRELMQVNQAISSLRNVYESRMRADRRGKGPTIAEMGVLMVMGQAGRINARTLSGMMGITPGTLSLYLSRLQGRGLVAQERDAEDKRTWLLSLTAKGKKAYLSSRTGAVRYTSDLISCLGPEERKTLHGLLLKLSHANGYEWQ